jgi:ribosomal protein S12 methylthiotransferase accessory factor YcaO
MVTTGLSELGEIAAASVGDCLGELRRVSLPDGCPIATFVCAATLPDGCLSPPGPLPRRIGAGSALDVATARDLCLLEGIERFSLQYRDGDPDQIEAVDMPGCRQASLPTWRLRLGHPAYLEGRRLADSRGCAAGAGLADAALRGLLELAEHEAVEAWHRGEAPFSTMDAAALDETLYALVAWLKEAGLRLRLLRHRHRSGAVVCVAICMDASGARPAIGSAADLAVGPAALHACLEAVVTRYNLVAIENKGRDLDETTPETRFAVEIWRGLRALPPNAEAADEPVPAVPAALDPETALAELLAAWGIEAAVFDLTRPETGITTVRMVRLGE